MIDRRSTYAQSNHQDYIYDRYLAEFLVNAISDVLSRQQNHRFRVLDVGCGEQPLRTLVEESGALYMSTDIAQNQSRTVDFLVDISSPHANKTISGQFELIILSEVLEHVPDPYLALQNIKKLLAPSGKAVITTPFIWPLHEQPLDYQRLTSHWFDKHVASVGLRVVTNESLGSPIDVLITLLLKTHIYADLKSASPSWLSKVFAFVIKKIISFLIFLFSMHLKLGVRASSSFYLVNCLILSD